MSAALDATHCPQCGNRWTTIAPDGYWCTPCDLFRERTAHSAEARREDEEDAPNTARPRDHKSRTPSDPRSRGPSQADTLAEMGQVPELFHDSKGTAFARLQVQEHFEIWPVRSKRFKNWLRRKFYREQRKAPSSDAVNSACEVLDGIANYEGPEHELHNRVAWLDGAIYYDLTDAQWRAVRIDAAGWQTIERPPILFRRYAHQLPQVRPAPNGDVRQVLRFLNVRPEHQQLLLIWLVTTFVPDIPHPVPDFHGDKGSGKSDGQRVLRKLIDPSAIESLSFPSDAREMAQQLSHHYAPVYDNIDNLPSWLSDIICRAITGAGFSKRELYSDDEDVIYSYQRVVMLNGVNVVARKPDLLDRTILIGLDRIPQTERREEREFWEAFDQAKPYILGGIFDALSAAMRIAPSLELPNLERMADFTRWGAAVSEALGYGRDSFLRAYSSNIGEQTLEAVQGHIVGNAVWALMDGRAEWSGSPTELLAELEEAGDQAKLFKRAGNGKVDAKGWPGAPHVLSRRLNEVRSSLADLGLEITEARGDNRVVTIRRTRPESGETSVGSDVAVDSNLTPEPSADATDATDAEIPTPEAEEWEKVIQ